MACALLRDLTIFCAQARVGHLESFLTKQSNSLKEIEGVVKTKHREKELFEEPNWDPVAAASEKQRKPGVLTFTRSGAP